MFEKLAHHSTVPISFLHEANTFLIVSLCFSIIQRRMKMAV